MSKKMSMQDMKEVRRIVTNILTDSIELIPCIRTSSYRNRVSFSVTFGWGEFSKAAENVIKKCKDNEELSAMQVALTKKKKEVIKSLLRTTKDGLKEAEDDDDNEHNKRHDKTSLRDDFGVIDTIESTVEKIYQKRSTTMAEAVAQEYNEYLSKIESRTFDAYTKGMSADDFLAIVRDEVKALQTKATELTEELKRNGYAQRN